MPAKTHKRKKNTRQHGSGGHGWGAKKKHRGSGNRGGKGNAGSGKRGASRRPSIRFVREYFGKHGFTPKNTKAVQAVNIQFLEESADRLVREGKAKATSGAVEINLKELGIDKLLSKGQVQRKFTITVFQATPGAIGKIKAAGGSVTVLAPAASSEAEGKQ